MNVELLINVCEYETRVALVGDGLLQELHLSRAGSASITGNVYLGVVQRVIPGMQAAFIDIGLERPGFLHARDIARQRGANAEEDGSAAPDIRKFLQAGERVLVQVNKDPISSKGARLSTDLAIASRYTVLMPFSEHIGISQRIEEDTERERLRSAIEELRAELGIGKGFIARTAAEGVGRDQLAADLRFLERLWERLLERRVRSAPPACIYEELPLHIRMVRDVVSPEVERIIIDDAGTFRRVQEFVSEFLPEFESRLHLHDEAAPLFSRYGVEEEIQRALKREVPLKCGGSIVIEQTEAMTTVDVNTGAYLGSHDLEETVFRTNMEAAQCIPRQLRLRNLGGIVVIDFIDMLEEAHKREVMRVLEKSCDADSARIRIEGFSSLGLVQMSRKRTSDSLVRQMCEPCERCEGRGVVKSAVSTCGEILRSVALHARKTQAPDASEYVIRAAECVVDRLLDEDAAHLERLSRSVGRTVRLQVEPCYLPGQYDLVLVQSARG